MSKQPLDRPITITFHPLSKEERAEAEDAKMDTSDLFLMQASSVGPVNVQVDPDGNMVLTARFLIPAGLFAFQKTTALTAGLAQNGLDISTGVVSPPVARVVCKRSGLTEQYRNAPAVVAATDTTPASSLMPSFSRLNIPSDSNQ